MKTLLITLFMLTLFTVKSQCKIESEVLKDGLDFKHTEKKRLYYTHSYTLFSAAFNDGQRYYLKIIIQPMKSKKVKKDDVTLVLKNGDTCKLDFYDSFQVKKDTSLDMLFEIKKELLSKLTQQDIKSIKLPTSEGTKKYNLIEQHALIREQLTCLMNELEKKK